MSFFGLSANALLKHSDGILELVSCPSDEEDDAEEDGDEAQKPAKKTNKKAPKKKK